jgi:hypothetical protein
MSARTETAPPGSPLPARPKPTVSTASTTSFIQPGEEGGIFALLATALGLRQIRLCSTPEIGFVPSILPKTSIRNSPEFVFSTPASPATDLVPASKLASLRQLLPTASRYSTPSSFFQPRRAAQPPRGAI